MKPGDLVVPWDACSIRDVKEPTFSSRGRSRIWQPDHPAIIVGEAMTWIANQQVPKFQILLDGELWWTTNHSAIVRLVVIKDETG